MYRPVASSEVVKRVEHIRDLLRQLPPANDRARLLHERRERRIKDFITNLRRTNARAMVQTLDELGTQCLLTKDGAYRLFGYSLDALREYDRFLNSGRTHIVESYVFERDTPVELPLILAPAEEFERNAWLHTLVVGWQSAIPIRALSRPGWHHPGTFHVHVGTQDSLGSSLPPGSTALVEPVDTGEANRPNPQAIYLLQFRNGYRCSRCVATRGKLQLLSGNRSYFGQEEFAFPGSVRVAGRIRAFALNLPQQESSSLRGLWTYPGSADLILPWEHRSRWSLLATKHRRFVRPHAETKYVQRVLQTTLQSKVSERTRRRYRRATDSEPHADALMQMCVEHFARYSDVLRTGGYAIHDAHGFSLETMLRAATISDVFATRRNAMLPTPRDVWDATRKQTGGYPALFALEFSRPSVLDKRVLRVGEEVGIGELEPRLRPGSWMLLEDVRVVPDTQSDASKRGWAKPLYVMCKGMENFLGYLHRDGDQMALLSGNDPRSGTVRFGLSELSNLRRICGVVVPT